MDHVAPERADGPARGVDLKTDQPHSARIYDYVLGGKDNYQPDRDAARQMLAGWPGLRTSMTQNRAFMHRAARHLAAECGIRQFLDIGTGIPTSPNLHEVVQEVAPDSRIVYVDNDPIVLVHARALLTSSPEGSTAYVDADMRNPAAILGSSQVQSTLDLTRPVALSLIAILHFIPDEEGAYEIVRSLLEPLPAGSFLALTTATTESNPEQIGQVVKNYNDNGIPFVARSRAGVERFFDGVEMVEPGVTLVHHWRPDTGAPAVDDRDVAMYGGVARKP